MPQTTVQHPLRRVARRWLRSACTALAGLLLITCSSDSPVGPGRPGIGSVRVTPVFDAFARVAPLTLDNVRVIVVRPAAETLAVVPKPFNPNSNQLQVNVPVLLQSVSEDLLVTLELYSGTTLLFSGTQTVRVSQGSTTPPSSIPVSYQGPGSQVASLLITPRDTTVSFGAIFPYTVNALDGQAQPVAQYYVSWSTPGAPTGTSIDGSGRLTAPSQRDTFFVKVATPNGVVDSTSVIIAAAPSALVKSGGDGQTGLVGTRLAQVLAVQVNGSDGLPVPGATVNFAAATGGGSVDSATATTDAQGIARTGATLGAALGAQTFTATVTGLAPVTFATTASGIAPIVVTLDGGLRHTCEIRGGTLFCWGDNGSGQLGDGTTSGRLVPVPVTGSFTSVSAGGSHTCALTAAGQAFCWGDNGAGQLGDGSTTNRGTPTAVTGGRVFVEIVAGGDFTCGLTAGGQAFCWGDNGAGQLGTGIAGIQTQPTAVSGPLTFATLAAGESHACGVTPAGAAFCWGFNSNGQLGSGNLSSSNVPVAVTGGQTFTAISTGRSSTCGIAAGGAGFCWGLNFGAQLTSPQPVAGGFTYTALTTGGNNHICALTAGGWRCAGDNAFGQLGDGSAPTDQSTPVLPSGGFTFTAMATGGDHTCGRTTTAITLCWGDNSAGQLGTGTTTPATTPVLTLGPATSVAVNAGDGQSAAPGAAVAIPPSVVVLDALSNPVPGIDVVFAVASGGGSVVGGAVQTDAAGIAAVGSWVLGGTAGSNTLTATVGSGGVSGNPVTFTATGTTPPPVRTWTGSASIDWSNPNNWNPVGVPNTLDDVTIVPATNQPTLTANSVTHNLTIAGAGARVTVAGHTLTISGNLTTHTDGLLVMTNPADLVIVAVDAAFQGGDETGLLSAGELRVAGDFAQQDQTNTKSFFASGTHRTVMNGTALQVVRFCCVAGASGFQELDLSNSVGINIQFSGGNGVFVYDTLISQVGTGTAPLLYMLGSPLRAARLRVDKLLVDRGTLTLNEGGVPANQQFDNVTFQNYLTTQTQFAVVAPGGAGVPRTLTFNNLLFQPLTTGNTGRYLNVTVPSGTLIVDLPGASPGAGGNGPAFTTTSGAVTVNWPSGAAPGTWTGAVDTSWNTAGNWSDGNVPTGTTDVTIPSGTPFAPATSGAVRQVRNLTVLSGATLAMGGGGLSVNGSLDAPGLITGNVASFVLAGTGTARGNVAGTFFSTTVNGSYTLNGRLVTPGLTINGQLDLAGFTAVVGSSVGDDFQTVNNGVLVMTNALDSLIVGGAGPSITFNGGSTVGKLTSGVILVNSIGVAGFTQDNIFNDSSYAPSGTHKLVTGATSTMLLSMATPGTGSHFNILDLSAQTGGVTLQTPIRVNGLLISTPASTAPAINGSNRTVTAAGGTQITGLTLTNTPLAITGDNPVVFDNVTLQGFLSSATQLSVSGSGATPRVFNNLVFATVPTTGFYLSATDTDGAGANGALTVDLVNPSPATPGAFAQAINGAVINWPAASPANTWTGTVSTDWNTAGNWSKGTVPTNADDVVIPSAANQPVITTSCSAKSLTVNAGATLGLGAFNCQVGGNVFADGSITGSGALQLAATSQLRGSVPSLIASGTTTLVGPTTLNGNLTITNGSLVVGGQGLGVVGSLITQGTGILVMTNPVDSVVTSGAGTFGGGDETGSLTAGHLILGGSFGQTSGNSGASFAASGTHRTDIGAGGVRVINFASPGAGAGTSHFNDLVVSRAAGGINLSNNTFVNGQLISHPTGATPVIGVVSGPKVLTVGGVDVSALGVDQHVMTIGAGTITQFDNVAFTGQANAVTQLTINNPGTAAALTFNGLSFAVAPTTGLYLAANDFDGATPNALTINMNGASPAAPSPSLFSFSNGALVNWPGATPPKTWTGAVNTDWSTASNWSPAGVPTATEDVIIPLGTPFSPIVTASCAAKRLTVNTGATLDLSGIGCVVQGDVLADGAITNTFGALNLQGTGNLRGTLPGETTVNALMTLIGPTTVTGRLLISGASGALNVNGQSLDVAQQFITSGSGVLVMTNPADVVTASLCFFGGGDETGKLTAGLLKTQGLTQSVAATSATFAASGTHVTEIFGSAVLSMQSAGAGAGFSHIQDLVSSGGGSLTIQTGAAYVLGTTTFTSGGGIVTSGAPLSFHTGQLVSSVPLSIANTQLWLEPGIAAPISLSNVTFNVLGATTPVVIRHPGLPAGGRVTLDQLTFVQVPTSPAVYLDVDDTAPGDGNPLVVDVTNTTPSSPSGLVLATNGAVINWPPAAPVITWTGSVSTDWSVAGNWSPAQVPTAANDVVIPAFTPIATVTSTCAAKSLVVAGQLSLGTFNCQVQGNVLAGGVIAGTTGAVVVQGTGQINGTFPNLVISAPVTVAAATGLGGGNGNLTITGVGASLTMNGQTLVAPGNLSVQGAGLLVMNNPADVLTIQGSATFDGGNESGQLTAGTFTLGGNFTQAATSSGNSFLASGSHRTVLIGTGTTVAFATPASSHFQDLDVTQVAGAVTLNSNVTVAGQLISVQSTANGPTVDANGSFTLTAGGADVGAPQGIVPLTMDGVPLVLSGGAITNLSGVLFANQSPVGIALTVNNVGTAAPFTFASLNFTTLLSAGGLHIQANDLDGASPNALTIDVIGANPASGAGVSQANNGAVIFWPPVGSLVWTGATSSDWSTASNWDLNRVPTAVDDATIGIGTPNQPKLSVSSAINNLTIQAGAIVDLDTTILVVTGNLDNNGSITGVVGTAGVSLAGTGKTLHGTIGVDVVIAPADYTLNGNLDVQSLSIAGANGSLTLAGHQLTTTAGFSTLNFGTVTMTNPADVLVVGGLALFAGGDETFKLTAGQLHVAGDFNQVNFTSQSSFAASGTHMTVLDGTAIQTVSMTDTTLSNFNDLTISNTTGVDVQSLLKVVGNMDLTAGAQFTALIGFSPGANVSGNLTTASGSSLTASRVFVGGTLNVGGAWNATQTVFTGSSQTAPSNLGYQQLWAYGTVTMAPGPLSVTDLVVSFPASQLTLSGPTIVSGNVLLGNLGGGNLKLNGNQVRVAGSLTVDQGATLTMQSPSDSLVVGGIANFIGASETGLLTAGVLELQGGLKQTAAISTTSFAPSGTHKTKINSATAQTLDFGSPGTGTGGSHFQVLDLNGADGGATLTVNSIADSVISTNPAAKLLGGGASLTMRRAQISGLTADNTTLILDEQGVAQVENMSGITFQGFGTTGSTMMKITGPGGTVSARPAFTTNNVNFQSLPIGAGNLYVDLTSTNGGFFTLTMTGSNQSPQIGGNGPTNSSPPNQIRVAGALINWP